ncbi:hypothetical protein [Sphingomonas lacusdianchii]|uniref:hypothetical protein n=1 Tax=Sphingomonas lacusdianchii TaxID=2917992 RepID=UPI001F5750FD|nr:hypothetical protein [Sphingomonas sp. JXJ CY 53]
MLGLISIGKLPIGRIAIATAANLLLVLFALRGHALTHGLDLITVLLGIAAIYFARYTIMFWPYLLPDRVAQKLG